MTHQMSDESIRILATGREDETQQVKDAVGRSLQAAPGALQHVVLYGPRGFGKSFMARLVQIETGNLAASEGALIPFVLLPEEQQNLTRNPHALLAYIAHRLTDLREGADRSWTGSMFQWPDPSREAQLWADSAEALERELDLSLSNGKGIAVVVIENFDFLLANVFKDETDEQRLRKWLDRPDNRVMLIATATGSVDMDYDRPLFQAFQSITLEPWSQDTCMAYFNRRRQAEGKAPLDAVMEAKARAIADFIGGNPRLAHLLANVLETQDALSVAGTMNALADKLSDYYRRRIDDLSPLAQGLLDALVRGGEPASQTELAERVGAPAQSSIARVMQDLQRADIIRGLPARDSRETLYRVTDRVFVHFYRLRQGNQLVLKTPLATILDFLRAFYSRDEQKVQALRHLEAGRPAEARLFADLAREGAHGDDIHDFSAAYFSRFDERLTIIIASDSGAVPIDLDALMREMEEKPEHFAEYLKSWIPLTSIAKAACAIISAQALARIGLITKADERLAQQLEQTAEPAAQLLLRHERGLLLFLQGNIDAARALTKFAKELQVDRLPQPLRSLAFGHRMMALNDDGDFELALDDANTIVALSEDGTIADQAEALTYVADLLGKLERYEEGLATARKAAKLAAKAEWPSMQARACQLAARMLRSLERFDKAEIEARKAVELFDEVGELAEKAEAMELVVDSLTKMGRYDEAVELGRETAALAVHANAVHVQANVQEDIAQAHQKSGRHMEALSEALAGFELGKSLPYGWGIEGNAILALEAAIHVASPDAIAAFSYWARSRESLNQNKESSLDWRMWLSEGMAAAARARNWWEIDKLIEDGILAEPTSEMFTASDIAKAIANAATTEGRAAGFEAARGAFPRLAQLFRSKPEDLNSFFVTIVSKFAQLCRDPGLLRDVARLLTVELAPEAPKQASLLLALAQLDESEDPQTLLARTDPDMALWLRRVRDLPEPPPSPRRRKSRGGNKDG